MKLAVKTLASPVGEIVPRLPPVTSNAPVDGLLAGASLYVRVIAAVWPDLSTAPLLTSLVIASVGASVSIEIAGVLPATPVLPAASR